MLATALVCLGASVSASGANAANAPVRTSAIPALKLSWSPCAGDIKGPGLQCATTRVPLSYRRPRGAKVKLFVMRHRASDRDGRLGTLFTNPGGPAAPSPGLPFIVDRFPELVTKRFDIVTWDPRGLGRSDGVQCFKSQQDEDRFFGDVPLGINPSIPVGDAEKSAWIDRYRAFGKRCLKRNGKLLKHMATANSARDLDLLRRSLGERKMTYFGESYGTFLGATYANMFPGRVRAIVVDGNVDPRAWTQRLTKENGGRFLGTFLRLRADQGSNATLEAFLRLCGETDTQHCAFSAGSAAATKQKYADLLERLRTDPASADITYGRLVAQTNGGLYDYPSWPELADLLESVWTNGTATHHAMPLRSALGAPASSSAGGAGGRYFGVEQTFSVVCSESPNPGPAGFRALDSFAFQRSGPLGQIWSWGSEPCATWPAKPIDRYAGPWNKRTANPVLVVGMTRDPATNYRGSLEMHRLLRRSRLLTIDGYGHGTFSNPSTCGNRVISRYLIGKKLPPKGARCEQDAKPFAENR